MQAFQSFVVAFFIGVANFVVFYLVGMFVPRDPAAFIASGLFLAVAGYIWGKSNPSGTWYSGLAMNNMTWTIAVFEPSLISEFAAYWILLLAASYLGVIIGHSTRGHHRPVISH